MPQRELVFEPAEGENPNPSLANRLQPSTPSQRACLHDAERIRCAPRAATTATNYDGKTPIANGAARGGTSHSLQTGITTEKRARVLNIPMLTNYLRFRELSKVNRDYDCRCSRPWVYGRVQTQRCLPFLTRCYARSARSPTNGHFLLICERV